MCTYGNASRAGRHERATARSVAAIGLCVLLLCATTAPAQVRQIQGGTALDASPMVGSGGYNSVRPVTSGINGNLIMSGNVTAGRSFQGFSPITNPNTLQVTIPSANLSPFVRDSVGLPAIQYGLSTYTPRPYFDPSQTTVSTGAIEYGALLPRDVTGAYRTGRGQYQMSAAPLTATSPIGGQYTGQLPYAAPGWTPAGIGMFNPEAVATTPGEISPNPLTQFAVAGPLSTSEVGRRRPSQTGALLPEPAEPLSQTDAQLRRPGEKGPFAQEGEPGPTTDQPGETPMVQSLKPGLEPQPAAGPLDEQSQTRTGRQRNADQTGSTLLSQMQQYAADRQQVMAASSGQQKPITQTVQQPMDLSVETAAQRPGDEQRSLQSGTPQQQQRLRTDTEREHASKLVAQRLATPIRSLAGARKTPVDQMLARAEELLRKGEYYRAAETYNGVITAAPDNPLAWMGRANALLAAGEYLQAYLALARGISQFPEMLTFDLDLASLVGNRDVLDVRRAELEKMLATRPDYRLQFLLGYLEYFSGVQNVGLQTIKQAVKIAPADSIVPKAYEVLVLRGAPASQPAK